MSREPFAFVIFGGTGDLARSKLLPALQQLATIDEMPDRYAVVGVSRSPLTDEDYRKQFEEGPLTPHLYYHSGDANDSQTFVHLRARLAKLDKELGLDGNRLFYLAVAPDLFLPIIEHLAEAKVLKPADDRSWVRVIIEKPFGHDLESAKELNRKISKVLDEKQVYRIDHYLGKETVQNILAFRFGNSIFEPLFNRTQIKMIHITVSEAERMPERRGAYYDKAGASRDIVQNHVLQLLCLIAMEPPASFDAESIRDEKVKVLRALPALGVHRVAQDTVRGQYRGYREEEGVNPNSMTETYVAIRTTIDNWRWSGVPIVLRTGKALQKRLTEIVVEFNQPPLCLFKEFDDCPPDPNVLILRIQPNEGISLSFVAKKPGPKMDLQEVKMDFSYGESFGQRLPEAYERLILDALHGDPSLFTRADEVECAWKFITNILETWRGLPDPVFPNYEPGSDGPAEANRLLNPSHSRRQ